MLYSEAYQTIVARLEARYGNSEAASIAAIVLEDAFQWKKSRADAPMEAADEHRFNQILDRLFLGEPLQYVMGEADFFGLKFIVSPAVLIPRQETEELVDWALHWLKTSAQAQPVVLDIGLGSGCIGLTIKKKCRHVRLYGMEKSAQALETALANARRLFGSASSDIHLLPGDILDRSTWEHWPVCDLIVSNPPYIPFAEKKLMPAHVYAHEPALSLFVDDDDPLLFYKVIAAFARLRLQPGGALLLECNEFHAVSVSRLLESAGFEAVQLRKDLAGADRMAFARQPLSDTQTV